MIMKFISTADSHLSSKNIAVAGVSKDLAKFGGKVFKNLKKRGYNVYPVNPKIEIFEGQKCFANIKDLPEDVELLVCVTPPSITEKLVKEAVDKGIKQIWLQPGAESQRAIELCEENEVSVLFNTCIMMNF
ncbi:MAG TPA: CoA-binding protein [Spirochaeta sp.]|nr:CoA-binding protein [Spirochaeta sp.]